MIRSAVFRLSLSYLVIIMSLSIGFSFWLYHISYKELTYDLRRPVIEQLTPGGFLNFDEFRTNRLNENQDHLQQSLILLNIGVLILGSVASYALAKRTLKPIEQSMEAQSRFTADASHELRTPLTAMETEIEVALRDKKLSIDQATELLKSNLEEVIKLKALSDSLLTLAYQDNADEHMFKPVDLAKIAQSATDQLASVAKKKHITIKQVTPKSVVKGDDKTLNELAIILLDNAIKYSEAGQTVRVKTKTRGQWGRLTIEDEGIGIKASDLPHIFERFYRTDPSRSKNAPGGHGLGLSIAQKIVELHAGSITVRSTFGKGTSFIVSIPLLKD
jgi:signal transduction histidine kinase